MPRIYPRSWHFHFMGIVYRLKELNLDKGNTYDN
jgi:hypothetical protein